MENETYINHIFDKFFKSVFQVDQTVIDFLNHILSPEIAGKISVEDLTLDSGNYISNQMSEAYADVIYRTVWKDGRGGVALVLLFEHKSSPDSDVFEQLLSYKLAIWAKDRSENRKRSDIYPIIFYQGQKPWIKKTFAQCLNSPPEMEPFVPNFDYILISVEETPDALLLQLSDFSILGAAMLLMKKARDENFIRQSFSSFYNFAKDRPYWNHFLPIFSHYLRQVSGLPTTDLRVLAEKNLTLEMQTQVIAEFETAEMQDIRKGIEIGKAQGKAQGKAETLRENVERMLIKKKLSDIDIADGLDVPLELVLSIKEDLQKSGRLKK